MANRNRKKLGGRSALARIAHFRGGAGAMGGNKKQQARRRRREDRKQEKDVEQERP